MPQQRLKHMYMYTPVQAPYARTPQKNADHLPDIISSINETVETYRAALGIPEPFTRNEHLHAGMSPTMLL
jgi:hypothetical protein